MDVDYAYDETLSPPIIRLEDGWNEKIKKKVCVLIVIDCCRIHGTLGK